MELRVLILMYSTTSFTVELLYFVETRSSNELEIIEKDTIARMSLTGISFKNACAFSHVHLVLFLSSFCNFTSLPW